MSEENVEVVRRLIEHWEQGDWRWGRDVFDDECEAVFSASWFPEADNYRVGAEALRAWNGFRDAFETFEVRLDRIIDAGDRVVALTHIQARGQASGAAVDAFTGGIFTLRGGKIVRYVLTDSREALGAVGLGKSPMSQENIEIVRLAYAALSEADRDALTELTDSNWVFDFSRSIGPDEGVYRGREQVFRFAATYGEAFERFQLSPIEYVVGPGGEIVVRHQVSAKGRGSGVEWERVPDAAMVWELRDDKVIKTTLYQHHAEAIEAVGLRE